jgi:hypothetical protein
MTQWEFRKAAQAGDLCELKKHQKLLDPYISDILNTAIEHQHGHVVRWYIAQGLPVDVRRNGDTAVHVAVPI